MQTHRSATISSTDLPRGPSVLFRLRRRVEPRMLAVEIGSAAFRAVGCTRSGSRIAITAATESAIGEGVNLADVLETARIKQTPAILALARDTALVGTTELPAEDEAELRGMARIALARDYTPDGVESLGDFQFARREGGSATVVVAAAARTQIDQARNRGDINIARVSVRTLGTLVLIRTSDPLRRGTTLVVDIAGETVEFTTARDGVLLNSRGVSIAADSSEVVAASVIAEFRRLLVALRGMSEGFTLDRIAVFAEEKVSILLSVELSRIASCAASRFVSHAMVDLPGVSASEAVRGGLEKELNSARCESFLSFGWPLAGLLLEDEAALRGDGSAIDLLHPTPLIDVGARSRQRALVIAGVVVIASLAGWTVGSQSWSALEDRRDELKDKARNALPDLRRAKRDEFRLRHIDAYASLAPAWLGHFETLRRFAPDPNSVVLDGMTAQLLSAEVEYGSDGAFSTRPELRFVIDGEAKDRATADALRDTLVKEKGYTLGSTGADARGGRRLPSPFAYTLRTGDLSPRGIDSTSPASSGKPSAEKTEGKAP